MQREQSRSIAVPTLWGPQTTRGLQGVVLRLSLSVCLRLSHSLFATFPLSPHFPISPTLLFTLFPPLLSTPFRSVCVLVSIFSCPSPPLSDSPALGIRVPWFLSGAD